MSTVSISLPSDGQTIDAADYNVPINTIVSELNGNIDSNNIAAGGVASTNLATGIVVSNKESNPYKFHVTSNAGLSVGQAATQLQWQVEIFDTNNNFATNQYTAPVTGFYKIYAYVHLGANVSATSAAMHVWKNGVDFSRIAYEEATNQGYGMQGSILMSLTAGDTVRIYIVTTGAAVTSIASSTDVPYFGGYLVSGT